MEEYKSFVFMASWRELLDSYEEDDDIETAKEILWQIMKYGTAGYIDTDNKKIRGIIKGTIAPNIDKAQERYNKAANGGNKGGRPRKEIDIEEVNNLIGQGMNIKQVAEYFGVSDDTIRRRMKENERTIRKTAEIESKTQKPYIDIDIEKDIEKDKEKEKEMDPFLNELNSKIKNSVSNTTVLPLRDFGF